MDTPESEEKFMVQIPSAAWRKHATRVQTLRTEKHASNKSGQISLTGPGHVFLLLLIMIYLENLAAALTIPWVCRHGRLWSFHCQKGRTDAVFALGLGMNSSWQIEHFSVYVSFLVGMLYYDVQCGLLDPTGISL